MLGGPRRRRLLGAAGAVAAAAVVAALAAGAFQGAAGKAAIPTCTGTAAFDLGCQLDRYAAIVHRSGIDAAFAALERAYERQGFVRAGCHPIVHEIGHAAVERFGDDLAAVYAKGDPFCSAGYYHGATEQIAVDIGATEFVARTDSVCAELGGAARRSIDHRNCAHGLGHGFMLVLDGELPDALASCDGLADGWETRSCYGGVFMQNVMALDKSKYLRRDQPLYPCAELDRRYREMCYQKQTGYALFLRNDDFGAVFALCARVEAAFQPACYRGLGTNIAVHNLKQVFGDRDRTALTIEACRLATGAGARVNCIEGAVRALINYDHAVNRAVDLCDAAPRGDRAACLREIEDKRRWPE